jgi:hypothetical protein
MRTPKRVSRWIQPVLHECLKQRICARSWSKVLWLTDSENRISLCLDLILSGLVPANGWPALLAEAISDGDFPARDRARLIFMLTVMLERGERVFDGDAAREAFSKLPERVVIYRGTVEAEGTRYGVCWTLDRDKARWFAMEHGRFRNRESPPVLLTATVARSAIAGLLIERSESEVLICPDKLASVTAEALHSSM